MLFAHTCLSQYLELSLLNLASHKRDIGKQCSLRSDAASGSTLARNIYKHDSYKN